MVLILFFIILVIILLCTVKSNLLSSNTTSTSYNNIKNRLKSGDLLIMTNDKSYVKEMYLLYRHGSDLKVITADKKGKIKLINPERIINKSKYIVYAFSLLKPLTNLQEESIRKLLSRNFAGLGKSSCILRYNNKQYFYNCDTYIIQIMSIAGILGIGPQFDCINNSYPKCLQQFDDTSIYINEGLFNNSPYLIKGHPTG